MRTLRNFEPALHQKQDNTLKSDGKTTCRHIVACEFSNHLVVSSTAAAGCTKLRHCDLKNGSGIIAHCRATSVGSKTSVNSAFFVALTSRCDLCQTVRHFLIQEISQLVL